MRTGLGIPIWLYLTMASHKLLMATMGAQSLYVEQCCTILLASCGISLLVRGGSSNTTGARTVVQPLDSIFQVMCWQMLRIGMQEQDQDRHGPQHSHRIHRYMIIWAYTPTQHHGHRRTRIRDDCSAQKRIHSSSDNQLETERASLHFRVTVTFH